MTRGSIWSGGLAAAVLGVAVLAAGRLGSAGAQDGPPPPPPPPPDQAPVDMPAPAPTTRPLPPLAAGERRVVVTFADGHDTDDRDHGRPVVLIAAALGVPADVFRETFTHVHPARGGQQPTDDQVRKNKIALMAGLSKYGVTNDRLNAVSNYYRYLRSRDGLWRHREATAYAVVRDGAVTRFDIADAGAGYTTPPTVTIDGLPDVAVTATLTFGKDMKTNGSVATLALAAPPAAQSH